MDTQSLRGKSVLVTGGGGFVGSHLTDTLVAHGAEVRVFDNFSTGKRKNLQHLYRDVEILEGDLRDRSACAEACAGRSVVFHQAALGSVPRSVRDPATTIAVNVSGTANLFTAARDAGVERIVYASSSSVYGDSETLPKREGEEGLVLSPYAASKRMNEELARQFALHAALQLVGLRYFNVYGPRQDPEGPYAAVIPRFFKALLTGTQPVVYGDGEQSRDFTAVADAVQANLLAATCPNLELKHTVFNVATGRRATVNEIADKIGGLVGVGVNCEHLPPREGDVRHSLADLSAIQRVLSYQPESNLERGLERCLPYYEFLYSSE